MYSQLDFPVLLDYHQIPWIYAICHRENKTVGKNIFLVRLFIIYIVSIKVLCNCNPLDTHKAFPFFGKLFISKRAGLVLLPYFFCILSYLVSGNVLCSCEIS